MTLLEDGLRKHKASKSTSLFWNQTVALLFLLLGLRCLQFLESFGQFVVLSDNLVALLGAFVQALDILVALRHEILQRVILLADALVGNFDLLLDRLDDIGVLLGLRAEPVVFL